MQKINLEKRLLFVDNFVELCYNIGILLKVVKMISYNNLWKTCIDKKLKKTDLMKITGISSATLAKLSNDEPVSLRTIETICNRLNCDISDVVLITDSKGEMQHDI